MDDDLPGADFAGCFGCLFLIAFVVAVLVVIAIGISIFG